MPSFRNFGLTLLASAGLALSPLLGTELAQAQRVVNVTPSGTNQAAPADSSISGVFDTSDGSRVDVSTVQIFVNDRNVTSQSTITPSFFSYRPSGPLPPGSNNVRVEFRNQAGQSWRASWGFVVQQPQTALNISSITHNAATQPLGAGSTFLATINGTPGASGSVLLIANGQTIREIPTQEVSSGVYVATLNLSSGDQLREGVVVGRLQRQGNTIYGAAAQAAAFNPGSSSTPVTQVPQGSGVTQTGGNQATQTPLGNLKPSFTSHQDGGTITSEGFTLVGQTQPGALVRVRVFSRLRALGGIVSIGGDTPLVEQEVRADAQGRFEVIVPRPTVVSSGTQYRVEAAATDGVQASEVTNLTLTQR
ncbi:MAG: hypothetical protein HC910_00840 [Spirulinaceae cyanobacterium SM2_1_0]|nr:hypothetical protein [Spirulinaceae cyanobacterium SM2_1_0]